MAQTNHEKAFAELRVFHTLFTQGKYTVTHRAWCGSYRVQCGEHILVGTTNPEEIIDFFNGLDKDHGK